MKVIDRAVYRGPHLYSLRPMVRMMVDIGVLEEWPSDRIAGFTDRLLTAIPSLQNHGCCYGEPGGFVRRLRDGTWVGHVVEHVALELQSLAGAPTTRGKTRSVPGRQGVYNIMFTYPDEATGLLAGRLALQVVDGLLPADLRGLEGLDRLVASETAARAVTAEAALPLVVASLRKHGLGPSTQALVNAARRRGIPAVRLDEQSLIQLGQGANQRRIRASVTDRTGLIAAELAGDKAKAKVLLDAIGCPVAKGAVVRSADEAVAAAKRLRRPVVLKPLDGNHRRGVTTGLVEDEAIHRAFDQAAAHSGRVIVEEELPGDDHRVLVVDGRVVAVAQRVQALVVGDGLQTVRQLVEQVNADPRRGRGHETTLTRIEVEDTAAADCLARQSIGLDDVPANGRLVVLRTTANLSSGGTAVDRTNDIHPDNAAICRRAALAIGLDVAGIDLMAPDIRRSVRETGGGIVEVNAAPGLRMHLAPSEGQPRDVARDIIASVYPRRAKARIPVLAVTGTNGKSTTGRMLAHIFASQGSTVGLTNTSGVYIGEERVYAGDASGPRSARLVLRDPTVEVAVLECARGGILREGLAFDRCDVGAVLNVQPDHLGLKGIDTLDQLAAVKSVVVEAVGKRGVSVLNADDPLTLRMARRAGGRIGWFSLRGGAQMPGLLMKHIADGGMACVYDAATGLMTLHDREQQHNLGPAADIPATFGGQAVFNIANALAASAMAYGAGAAPSVIRRALTSFASTFEQNPGRMNIRDVGGVRIILDYAHNPEGLRALGQAVAGMKPEGRTIAMLSVPGDRRDEEILGVGAVGAQVFDKLVFRETPDNRGRPEGDVLRLLRKGAAEAGADDGRIENILREEDAAAAALAMARPGDVVVLTPTGIDAVWKLVCDYRPAWLDAHRPENNPTVAIIEPPHG